MEQEELSIDPHYLKGFNNGYLLAKHQPELAMQLTVQPNDHSPYFKGLMGGKQEYDKEAREWAKSFSRGTPEKDDRDIEKER
jgi:hypothetical protein